MPTFEIICLANSKKYQGRCIAGLKTDVSGWLRPVSTLDTGTLNRQDYTLDNGQEPQLFDVIRVHCSQPRPKCNQPENWVLERKQWEFVGTPSLQQLQEIVNLEVSRNSSSVLLGSQYSHIPYHELEEIPALASLALIQPQNLRWRIVRNHRAEKRFRATFVLNGIEYDLPITDLLWQAKLDAFEEDTYTCQEVIDKLSLTNFNPKKFLLTISLSEPFIPKGAEQLFCYKLVAAITNASEVKKRLGFSP